MQQFLFSPQVGNTVLAAYGHLAAGAAPLVIPSDEAQQGLMAALVNLEAMAAVKGFATPITIGSTTGVIIGGARDKAIALAQQNDPHAILYLAQCANVRAAMAATLPAQAGAVPTSFVQQTALPLIPILITIAVVAIAASVAVVAWSHAQQVQVEAETAKQVGVSDQIVKLAASGKPIDPNAIDALRQIATKEAAETSPIPWGMVAGAVGVLALGWLVIESGGVAGIVRGMVGRPRR